MSYGPRITGMEEVKHRLNAIPFHLRDSVTKKTMGGVGRVVVKKIRDEIGSGSVRDTLRHLVKPNRKSRAKAKNEKGQITAAVNTSVQELKRSIGIRKYPRGRMRDKHIIFHAIGPRAGFKITNIRSTSKRIPHAATTVAKMVELGTTLNTPNAFTRRVIQMCHGPYQQAMLEAARAAIAKATIKG